jgi:glycosyltransferase involved in cell wall biosynthesis
MKKPIVSIMIPTYNQEEYIIRAIQSVLDQKYENIEILVSDDCSTDNTERIVNDFIALKSDSRIRYLKNDRNVGILRNYHNSLHRVSGDYVVNLDGDDFFVDNNFLSNAVNMFRDDERLSLVFGDYCEYMQPLGVKVNILNKSLPGIMSDKEFYAKFADHKILWNHNTIVYKRALAIDIGFYWDAEIPRNDWESFLRLIAGHRVGYLPFVVSAWTQHGGNETKRPDMMKYLNNYVLLKGVEHYVTPILGEDFANKWYKKMIWVKTKSSSVGFIKNKDIVGWLRFIFKIAEISPLLSIRAIFNPSLLARLILSINPGLYSGVKVRIRQFLK